MKSFSRVFYLLFFLLPILAAAQDKGAALPPEGANIVKAIPASPDAAALGKYGSIPVSPYTGIPNISIPLYTIKSGGITLPLSISYHAGGNKIEEKASSVGLGWVLNAGGVITRTIRGLPDEESSGFLNEGGTQVTGILAALNSGQPLNSDLINQDFNQMSEGTMDGEADMYNFNFGGYSGRFVMDTKGNITTIPQQKIRFSFYTTSSGPDGVEILSFTAVTPDGTTYIFGSDGDDNDAVENTASVNSCSTFNTKKFYATSWFIKQITDATGHEVNFTYTNERYEIGLTASESMYQFYQSASYTTTAGDQPIQYIAPTNCNISSLIAGVKLAAITFENGRVDVGTSERYDLANSDKIGQLSVTGDGFSKQFDFYYSGNAAGQRLRLDSLIGRLEPLPNSTFKKERYAFQYNPDNWNPLNLNNQDTWGYNNGHFENSTLVPAAFFTPAGSNQQVLLPGANRSTDERSMLGGMLTKIIYPTMGYTVFNFEANTEYNTDLGGTAKDNENNPLLTIANSNEPNTNYYNYDIDRGNPNDLMTIIHPGTSLVPVGLTGTGFYSSNNSENPDYSHYKTSALVPVDSAGIQNGPGYPINNADTTIYVPAGRYRILITNPKPLLDTGYYTVVVTWHNADTTTNGKTPKGAYHNFVAGGLRVQQIANYDGLNPEPLNVKTYEYTLPGQSLSSGWLDYNPTYNYYTQRSLGSVTSGYAPVTYFVRTAVTNYPLSTTQGAVVGYSHVTEYDGDQNGKTEYYYTNSQDTPDIANAVQLNTAASQDPNSFPFSPVTSLDWHRGLLTKQVTWKQTENGYAKVQQKENSYGSRYLAFMNNFKVGFSWMPKDFTINSNYFNNTEPEGLISVFNYTDYSDFTYLNSSTTYDYSLNDTTRYNRTQTDFEIDSASLQVAKITSTNSKNEQIIQTVTYPDNYADGGGVNPFTGEISSSVPGLGLLLNKNMLAYPVEEITQKSDSAGGNLRTVKAVLTTYKAEQPVREAVYEMRSVTPVTDFERTSPGKGGLTMDNRYQQVVSFDSYDRGGNILQEHKTGDAIHSYVWGYDESNIKTLPIAEVINAGAGSIAYTNFERYNEFDNGDGNWLFNEKGITKDENAPMGPGAYDLSMSNISLEDVTPGQDYIVSYWYNGKPNVAVNGITVRNDNTDQSGWTYAEQVVTPDSTGVTISGFGLIDELRLYPVNAQMNTYTYVPLAGISSKCDAKNQITYYNYDNVGRLQQVLDRNRHILKDYKYNYIDYSPMWADNGYTYCVQGPYGNTGEQMMQQTDTNRYSDTYNSQRFRSLGKTDACPTAGLYVTFRITGTSTTTVKGYTQRFFTYEAQAFADAECTTPVTLPSALTVNYTITATTTHGDGSPTSTVTTSHTLTIPGGSTAATVGTFNVSGCDILGTNTDPDCTTSVIDVSAGDNYVPVTGAGD